MRFFRKNKMAGSYPPEKSSRYRSLPSARHYRFAIFLCAVHYLCVIAMITTAVLLVLKPDQRASKLLIATAVCTIVSWFFAFLKRRTTLCPLCKGTPLLESGAHYHQRARRLPPLSHATTTILSVLFLQKFRCMYCGSDYDLLKRPGRKNTDSAQS